MATKEQRRRAAYARRFAHGFGFGAGRTKSGRPRKYYSSIKVGTRKSGWYGQRRRHSLVARKRNWKPYGEYWNREQVEQGKKKAKLEGYRYVRRKRGSYIGSHTLYVSN